VTRLGGNGLDDVDDNVAARRVYERLGFVLAHEVETWERA
jgi:RimJ/RimL family protein N-acetyltransferase